MGFFSDITPNELKGEGAWAYAAVGIASVPFVQQQRQQRKALRAQRRIADIQQQQQILQNIRVARAARADILSGAANSGAQNSSGTQGGTSSVSSQLTSNVGTIKKLGATNKESLRAQRKAGVWGAVAGLENTVFGAFGGFQTIFSSPPANAVVPGGTGLTAPPLDINAYRGNTVFDRYTLG